VVWVSVAAVATPELRLTPAGAGSVVVHVAVVVAVGATWLW
jgi:hypothetical protein